MTQHNHVILGKEYVNVVEYKSKLGYSSDGVHPPEDPIAHSKKLFQEYRASLQNMYEDAKKILTEDIVPAKGAYVELSILGEAPISTWEQLDTKKGPQLMNICKSDNENKSSAVVFLPEGTDKWLENKLQNYEKGPSKGRKNRPSSVLIDALDGVRSVSLVSFFSSKEEFNDIPDAFAAYELWLSIKVDIQDAKQKLEQLGIFVGLGVVSFEGLNVVLIKASKKQLNQMIHVVKPILKIRKYNSSVELIENSNKDDRDWTQIIEENIKVSSKKLSRIGVLDSGVNEQHPLISNFLPKARCTTVKNMSLGLKDAANHGTPTAGIVLYGDFSDLLNQRHNREITNELASVKMYHDSESSETEDVHKALVTINAIDKSVDMDAHLMVSSITSEASLKGKPTITSAAIDKRLFNKGAASELLLVSAGNRVSQDGFKYPDFLDYETIRDPAQAWNALTVGAMTEKVLVQPKYGEKLDVVAQQGGPSPVTTSSVLWGDSSLIKPEIVMEGGNAYWDKEGRFQHHEELQPVSLSSKLLVHNFTCFNATSAAVAMAANLAGEIQHYNPSLSPLSIRALMVHSAEWTETMKSLYTLNGSLDKNHLLHVCGYGKPNRDKAIMSSNSCVTFVHEDSIGLYKRKNAQLSFKQMHLYKLPWPKKILSDMGEAEVRFRVTLSYYIEPSPGEREILSKYRYPSVLLKFDVNRFAESEKEFQQRVSNVEDGNDFVKEDAKRLPWFLGTNRRNHGSIHSDFIKTSAANLAACNLIAVYPSSGWWKTRREKENATIKYSLVVSLETPETDIYTAIQQQIGIAVST